MCIDIRKYHIWSGVENPQIVKITYLCGWKISIYKFITVLQIINRPEKNEQQLKFASNIGNKTKIVKVYIV